MIAAVPVPAPRSALVALLALTAAAQPVIAAEKKTTVTRHEARTLAPAILAERLLGASGALYAEVERPALKAEGIFAGLQPELGSLRFAKRPRWSGFRGLCSVDIAVLLFQLPDKAGPPTTDSEVAVKDMSTTMLHRFIGRSGGEGADSPAVSDGAQERWCRNAGPVFNAPASGVSGRFFYGKSEYGYDLSPALAYFAGWAFETAQRSVAGAQAPDVACAEDPAAPDAGLCSDTRALIGRLRLDDISFVAVERCPDPAAGYCAEINFRRADDTSNEQRIWRVLVSTDATSVDPLPKAISVKRISMEAWTIAYD